MPPQILSPGILAEATHTGVFQSGVWRWKAAELPAVFQKAKELRIAAIGGDPQFVLPDGIHDMYWLSIEPAERADNETWEEYVIRSNDHCLALLTHQLRTVDFRKEARHETGSAKGTPEKGIDPLDHLYYEMHFNSEAERAELQKWGRESGFYDRLRRH